jgi:predicted nucleic acid-binding protein
MSELRGDITPYGVADVVLAEQLGAVLITCAAKLALAGAGVRGRVFDIID